MPANERTDTAMLARAIPANPAVHVNSVSPLSPIIESAFSHMPSGDSEQVVIPADAGIQVLKKHRLLGFWISARSLRSSGAGSAGMTASVLIQSFTNILSRNSLKSFSDAD